MYCASAFALTPARDHERGVGVPGLVQAQALHRALPRSRRCLRGGRASPRGTAPHRSGRTRARSPARSAPPAGDRAAARASDPASARRRIEVASSGRSSRPSDPRIREPRRCRRRSRLRSSAAPGARRSEGRRRGPSPTPLDRRSAAPRAAPPRLGSDDLGLAGPRRRQLEVLRRVDRQPAPRLCAPVDRLQRLDRVPQGRGRVVLSVPAIDQELEVVRGDRAQLLCADQRQDPLLQGLAVAAERRRLVRVSGAVSDLAPFRAIEPSRGRLAKRRAGLGHVVPRGRFGVWHRHAKSAPPRSSRTCGESSCDLAASRPTLRSRPSNRSPGHLPSGSPASASSRSRLPSTLLSHDLSEPRLGRSPDCSVERQRRVLVGPALQVAQRNQSHAAAADYADLRLDIALERVHRDAQGARGLGSRQRDSRDAPDLSGG